MKISTPKSKFISDVDLKQKHKPRPISTLPINNQGCFKKFIS